MTTSNTTNNKIEPSNNNNNNNVEEKHESTSNINSIATPITTLADIEKELIEAEREVAEFQHLVGQATKLQNAVKKKSLHLLKEIKSLPKKSSTDNNNNSNNTDVTEILNRIEALKYIIPETRSFFCRIMLGRINLKFWTSQERDRLRDEYNKFKIRSNVIFTFFPLLVLVAHYYLRFVWADIHWFTLLHQLWLLYYYTSLALRENILLVNGSNIRPWWIMHHYIAAFGMAILMTWPVSPTYLRFVPYWNYFLAFQGVVQVLQLLYQRKRDYALRALGRTSRMDVAFSETLVEFPTELKILIPILVLDQFWQIFLGLKLLECVWTEFDILNTHWTMYREEVQMTVCGIVAIVLGVGNLYTTMVTLFGKDHHKNLKRVYNNSHHQNNINHSNSSNNISRMNYNESSLKLVKDD
jgi:hypothetical protein